MAKSLALLLSVLIFSLTLNADERENENINGFTANESEVVFKAFEILTQQNWDQLTDENLTTLSQAAAIAMDSSNEHYSPKAAFSFMMRILEVQYDYKPLNELTQKVFKGAVLSVMRGHYRVANESERVLRNSYEFQSDLRQMREMLKRAKLVEQRKANECLFVNTLGPLLSSMSKEHIEKFKSGKSCLERPSDINMWCSQAFQAREYCAKMLPNVFGNSACNDAQGALLQTVLNPPPCANPIEIAGKLKTEAPYISLEQIEKTLNNEETELAFNMGLAFTDPVSQKKYHLIRDGSHTNAAKTRAQEVVNDDDEFDIEGSFSIKEPVRELLQLASTTKERLKQLADFAKTMDGVRFKTLTEMQANKPLLLGSKKEADNKDAECSESGCGDKSQSQSPTADAKSSPGIWNRLLKLLGV